MAELPLPARMPPRAPGIVSRLAARLDEAIPSPSTVLFGSVAWGALMAVSALIGLYFRNGLIVSSPLAVGALYFYGGALAFAPGLTLCRLLLVRRGGVLRFIGAVLIIVLATHTMTSGLFALQYRVFYAHWHANFPSVVWFFQLGFTSAAAVYQFTVDSLYIYLPLSPLLFAGFGLWFVRNTRDKPH